jgi:hypothetical protein
LPSLACPRRAWSTAATVPVLVGSCHMYWPGSPWREQPKRLMDSAVGRPAPGALPESGP